MLYSLYLQVYLCQNNFAEDFNFDCPGFPNHRKKDLYYGTEWYTVCANAHSNKFHFVMAESGLALLGIFMYRLAFSAKSDKAKLQ